MADEKDEKLASGWTMVNDEGEVVSDDNSDTSESSIEVISFGEIDEATNQCSVDDNVQEELVSHSLSQDSEVDIDSGGINETKDVLPQPEENSTEETSVQLSFGSDLPEQVGMFKREQSYGYGDEPNLNTTPSSSSSQITNDVSSNDLNNLSNHNPSMGACCAELIEQNAADEIDITVPNTENKNPPLNVESVSVDDSSPADQPSDDDSDLPQDNDSDSDFIRLEPEELEEEVSNNDLMPEREPFDVFDNQMVIPLRISRLSPSIGHDFVFMRNGDRQESDNEDRDEDTESSTEDSIDDRIESEQSEAGSNLYDMFDVGDLSSFDIGDIPLVVGDVARNYRHQPNKHLTNILNMIMVLSAILTMGISLGISMATDLEIEEWQKAHEIEVKKVNDLEQQISTLEKLWNHYKRETKELEELVTVQDKREEVFYMMRMHTSDDEKSFNSFLTNLHDIRHSYQDCIISKQLQPEACYSSISPNLVNLKASIVPYDVVNDVELTNTEKSSLEEIKPKQNNDTESTVKRDTISEDVPVSEVMEKNDKSLQFLPTEMKKEKDSVEISLDIRQLQQSLTREQERALRWQQLYLSERRQREKERESEEWEDERDRGRWEEERLQKDQVECLQKLMSSNLTTLTQHVFKWNVSVFDDFANLSMLMSTVTELQQSVINSVQRVWEEAEEAIGGTDSKKENKEGKEKIWEKFPNQKDLTSYVKKLLEDVKEEVEDVLKDESVLKEEETEAKEDPDQEEKKSTTTSKTNRIFGKVANIVKKTKKSVKKIGKKVIGFLGKVHDTWKDRKKWMAKMGSYFVNDQQKSSSTKSEKMCSKSYKDWLYTDKDGNNWVNVRSQCLSLIRSDWQHKVEVKGKDLSNEVGHYLQDLLNLKKVKPKELKFHDAKYSSISTGMFDEFLKKYASSGLVLGIDLKWSDCSRKWWSDALLAIHSKTTHTLKENWCHWVEIPFLYSGSTTEFEIIDSLQSWKHDFQVEDFRPSRDTTQLKNYHGDNPRRNVEKDNKIDVHYKDRVFIVEVNEKNISFNNVSKEKGQEKLFSDQNKKRKAEWQFKKAKDREYQRKEHHKSDWLFDRAEARRKGSDLYKKSHKRHKDPNWYLHYGNEREKIRKQDHQADWVFERAEDREKQHMKRNKKKGLRNKYEQNECKHKHNKYKKDKKRNFSCEDW